MMENNYMKNESKITKQDNFQIADQIFQSRLMLGTGRYKNTQEAISSIKASKASIITVAIRRMQNSKNIGKSSLIDVLNWQKLWLLPNTAGCETADEAIRIASLGMEINKKIGQTNNKFIKLEVISDSNYLLPDPLGTLKAAEYLINKGFIVLPYIYPDPILAKQLEDVGCHAIMPLGSPIGSGQGIKNLHNIQIIIENAKVPIIIDAGIGKASEANHAMEIGATAILINTAIAKSSDPNIMAESMKLGVISGRKCYLAGTMQKNSHGKASSPNEGILKVI
uniref:Thiazole synthase n=1 Tax=Polysiphonia infestans TaxID=2006978 RepID=A0A1Z1MEA5_9FLOR|nr:thiG protein [Polysiphonia infestans]ARW64293.1 thiG protein [Polysiphonia infestans]